MPTHGHDRGVSSPSVRPTRFASVKAEVHVKEPEGVEMIQCRRKNEAHYHAFAVVGWPDGVLPARHGTVPLVGMGRTSLFFRKEKMRGRVHVAGLSALDEAPRFSAFQEWESP